jgi:hypothetical protein
MAISASPDSIPQVVACLESIDALLDGAQDGLKWFNWLYLGVTKAVYERIQSGAFNSLDSTAFLTELDVEFANLYLAALRQWLATGRTHGCWQVLFTRRAESALARLQFALAGVNAHINHDLSIAIVSTCARLGIDPLRGGPHYTAYTELNTTLDALIDGATRELMVRLPGNALPSLAALEQTLAAWSVSISRDLAWTNAGVLWRIRDEPLFANRFTDLLDNSAKVAATALLMPL